MKASYMSLATSNEKVCIKGDRRVPVMDGERIVDYDWLDGLYARFDNYMFSTDDDRIITYMDNPKNGLGTLWKKLTSEVKQDKK